MSVTMNSLAVYAECGKRAATAQNQHDVARYTFERDWCRRALALESEAYRELAQDAYDTAYKRSRHVPRVEYFR